MGGGARPSLSRNWALIGFALIGLAPLGAVPLPPPLETAHLLGRGLPSGLPPVPLADELYALGWSPTNAFAVLERRTEVPQLAVRFRVLDLVDDKVLFEAQWPDWGEPDQKDAWWAARQPEVETVFSRFGLVPTDRQLGVFPLIIDNEFYTLALRKGHAPLDPSWVDRLEIVVNSTGRGLKTVAEGTGLWRWAALLGFVPSPFENRIALILVVQPAGWDGDKQPLRFLVSGLSLKAGFPKP